MQQVGDAIYGIPYHDGPECLIYRSDWFADPAEQPALRSAPTATRCGLPRTWEQFEHIARFFTRPDEGRYGTDFAAYPDGHNTVYDFCLQLWSRGGELHDAEGARPSIPRSRTPRSIFTAGGSDRTPTPPDLEPIDSVKSGELFAEGPIAMMVNWFGFAAYCEQPDSPVKGQVAIAPIPAGPGGDSASLNVYWLLGIAAGSKHQDAAYAFVKHCATPAMDKLTTLAGGIGCRLSTWATPR